MNRFQLLVRLEGQERKIISYAPTKIQQAQFHTPEMTLVWKISNAFTSQSLCRVILAAFAEEAIADHCHNELSIDLEFPFGEKN